jgi:hypothetical protein
MLDHYLVDKHILVQINGITIQHLGVIMEQEYQYFIQIKYAQMKEGVEK